MLIFRLTIITVASISICNPQKINNDENVGNYLAVSSNQKFKNAKDRHTIKTTQGHYHEEIQRSIVPGCNKSKEEDGKELTNQWLPSKLSELLPGNKMSQHVHQHDNFIPISDMRFIVENVNSDGTNIPMAVDINKNSDAISSSRRSYDKNSTFYNKEKNISSSNYETDTMHKSCITETKNKVLEFESISVQDQSPGKDDILGILSSIADPDLEENSPECLDQLNCTQTLKIYLNNTPVYNSLESDALSVLNGTGNIQALNSKLRDVEFNVNNIKTQGKATTRKMNTEDLEDKLLDPAKIAVMSNLLMLETPVMLLQNSRVCYACSTTNDPSCWKPDRRTTVKYCHKGHDACLTKTFSRKGTIFVTRDCGKSCVNSDLSGLEPKFDKCTICHKDLCNRNSAYSPNIHQLYFTIIISGMFSIKMLY